ncbi:MULTISPECIES: hypothetical protein [Thalassospira]|uniref:RcnB family protein n=2 Tax=Thalassospira TaxID=168934 RepID=A0A367W5D7_9PROT|nr:MULTISPECIES: hypothetical protein [Thalassospira]MDG4721002.1 hypothetical protein [Thalassospira sp. FZY0004]RCK36658.1 hypothetical protein TH19_12080 [Thalassospira profundimaris]
MPEKLNFSRIAMTASIAASAIILPVSLAQAHPSNTRHQHELVEVAQGGGIFSDEERRIIRDVLDIATGNTSGDSDRDHGSKGGKGDKGDKGNKGKGNKGLPPGIAMKLERGGTLPPGIAKRDLPANLKSKLPNRTDGAIRQIIGDDVVLIERGTNLILDIIRDVARNQ